MYLDLGASGGCEQPMFARKHSHNCQPDGACVRGTGEQSFCSHFADDLLMACRPALSLNHRLVSASPDFNLKYRHTHKVYFY